MYETMCVCSEELSSGEPLPFSCFAEWLVAPVKMALLQLAIDLNLPDILHDSSDLKSIATRLGPVTTDGLAYILDALVAAGLLNKADGMYSNGGLAESYLRTDKPGYLGDLVVMLRGMQHRNLGQLKDLLFGKIIPLPEKDALHAEEHWKQSVRGLSGYQKAGAADFLADKAAALPEAKSFRKMLDLGCGPGIIALSILDRLPELRMVLCDFPRMLEVARKEAADAGLAQRISCLSGDYNQVPFGRDFDLIWSCQSLYYARDLPRFLIKIRDSLRPGGYFVSIHEGICEEKTAPAAMVLSRLTLALGGQDVSFSKGQIASAAAAAGLARVSVQQVQMLFGASDFEVFRKEADGGGLQ